MERASGITMHASLFAAAFTLGGKVHVLGGIKRSFRASCLPLQIEPIGVAAILEVPPDAIDTRHICTLSLENHAGIPVLWSRQGPTASGAVRYKLEAAVDVAGPVPVGRATLSVPWCSNLYHVEVPDAGRYRLVLSVGELDACRLDFDVVVR
jgi:hypothetical protein